MFNDFNVWFYKSDNTCVKYCNYKFVEVRELLEICRVFYSIKDSSWHKTTTIRIKHKYTHFDITKDINRLSDICEVEKSLLDYMGLE